MFSRAHTRPAIAAGLLGLYVVSTTALPLAHNAHHDRAHGHAHTTPHAAPRTAPSTPVLTHAHAHAHVHVHGPAARHARHEHAHSEHGTEESRAQASAPEALIPLHTPDLAHTEGRVEHFGVGTLATAPVTLTPCNRVLIARATPSVRPTLSRERHPRARPRAPPSA